MIKDIKQRIDTELSITAPIDRSRGEKRGRPRKYDVDKTRPRNIIAQVRPDDLWIIDEIDDLADQDDRSRSQMIVILLEKGLNALKEVLNARKKLAA